MALNRIIVRSTALTARRPIRARRAVAVDQPAMFAPASSIGMAIATVTGLIAIAMLVVGVVVTS